MSRQPVRRRWGLALAAAVAALVALFGAGQAMATPAPPDEHVLERQGRIDHQAAARQAGEQGRVALPPQLSSEDRAAAAPAGTPRRFIRPEPPMGPGPQLGEQQVAPSPVRTASAGARGGLLVIVVVAALLLAVGAATTWRVRHRRPQPESTA
jgi:hypothetical protein